MQQIFFAMSAAVLVKRYSTYARHSGIPEIKSVLGGLVIRKYLGGWTLVVKSLGLVGASVLLLLTMLTYAFLLVSGGGFRSMARQGRPLCPCRMLLCEYNHETDQVLDEQRSS
jgi:hypothetical protein